MENQLRELVAERGPDLRLIRLIESVDPCYGREIGHGFEVPDKDVTVHSAAPQH
jgi:hypothetical protein